MQYYTKAVFVCDNLFHLLIPDAEWRLPHQASIQPNNLPSIFITKFHIPTSFESSDKNKGDLEVGNPCFLLYIKNKTYSCTTIKLQLYNYRGYSRTTIDFPQRYHLVKKLQISDYQQVPSFLHIYNILKETISV